MKKGRESERGGEKRNTKWGKWRASLCNPFRGKVRMCVNERVLWRGPDIDCQSPPRRAKPGTVLPRIGLMVNECSFVETDRRPSIVSRLDLFPSPAPSLSFFLRTSPSRKDTLRCFHSTSVAYIDTNHRLPFGSPSGFLVAVRQNPIATAVSLSCPKAALPFWSRNVGR